MSRPNRREDRVRRMLATRPAPIPPDLAARAILLGARVLRRKRAARWTGWVLLLVTAVVFTVWAVHAEPRGAMETTPTLEGW
ncbi:hypothetical protein [Streptomyces sp. NPDC020965]|uniref:hypothetical protein n=1 Tax=Streptomyces sp. NPDC020965 TaxID=3365105 RepID=UPI00379AAB90